MAQLDVPGRYDVEGGIQQGFPLIGIGFNHHMAWTHTVSTSRRFVAYQLHLVPGHPTSYYLDGKPTKMGQTTVSVSYDGKTTGHTFYTSHWGVVFDVPAVPHNAYIWNTKTAHAMYDPGAETGARTANQYLRMGQAASIQDLYRSRPSTWRSRSSTRWRPMTTGTPATATSGRPRRSPRPRSEPACLPGGRHGIPARVLKVAREVTLDGSRSSCAPATYAGTPQPGIFDAAHEPHLLRRDYVENSNGSYWLANPGQPLRRFSPIIGLTREQQGLRTRLGNEMIYQRVHGTDGLGPAKFDIPTMQRMFDGDRSKLAELVLSTLVSDCFRHSSQVASNGQTVDLTPACHALAEYDGPTPLPAPVSWTPAAGGRLTSGRVSILRAPESRASGPSRSMPTSRSPPLRG